MGTLGHLLHPIDGLNGILRVLINEGAVHK